jgi:predicted DNA-binding transcriptional regulator AlpA
MVSQRVYRLRQLASIKGRPGLLPVGPATVWRWVREQRFPAPFKLGEKTTVWDAAEVEAFIAGRRAGGA